MSRARFLRLLLCAALTACAGVAAAQNRPLPAPPPAGGAPARNAPALPEWDKLTPAQREAIIAVVRERWNGNPGERRRVLQHAERWRQMTPEQRRNAQQGQRRWEQMSPEQRKRARADYAQTRDLPPEERAALREKLKAMSPEERREWLRTHRRRNGTTP
jgi:hypothetical protein